MTREKLLAILLGCRKLHHLMLLFKNFWGACPWAPLPCVCPWHTTHLWCAFGPPPHLKLVPMLCHFLCVQQNTVQLFNNAINLYSTICLLKGKIKGNKALCAVIAYLQQTWYNFMWEPAIISLIRYGMLKLTLALTAAFTVGWHHVDLAGLYIPLVNPQRGLEPVA